MLPCGMAQVTVLTFDKLSFALRPWVRSLRNDRNHSIATWSAPQYDNLHKISRSKESFFEVNEDYYVQETVVDVNRPALCRHLKLGR